MNHMDYIDPEAGTGVLGLRGQTFLANVERAIDSRIDLVGISPDRMIVPHRQSEPTGLANAS
jgi:hypothetical protein